jgi:F-type H+-transporting ATPase subunit delta
LRASQQEVRVQFQRLSRGLRGVGLADERNIESEAVAAEDTSVSGMAGRYATALFELALESNSIDAVKADLQGFETLVAGNADLTRLVRSPVFSTEDQSKALSAILAKAGISGLAANFLKLVTSKRRLFAVGNIIRGFRTLVAHHKGEVTAQVTVAEKLSDARLAEIKDTLKTVTGKDIQMDVRIDPAIIGGLIVKLGSRMVDSSLRTKLNAIKHAMKEVG